MAKAINIGVDLGTTNTLVCTDIKGKIKCLKFKNGDGVVLPSVLYYENGEIIIGKKASEHGYLNPSHVIRSSKTYMGSDKTYNIDGMIFNPVSVATEILRSVKDDVYKSFKKEGADENTIINAVITVPAYFQSSQYEATKRAAVEAGINVLKIITEPTAAAISYISESAKDIEGKKLLVIDIGGGTFDLSYLEYDPNENEYKTLAVNGDKKLGGDDFDECIKNAMIDIVYSDTGIDLASQEISGQKPEDYYRMIARLQAEGKAIKEQLSNSEEAFATIPDLLMYKGSEYTFDIQWTRDEFNDICSELYDRIFGKIDEFLSENNISADDVWRVALAGGSCSIPYIGERIEKMFPGKVYSDQDLSTLVVKGAYTVAAASEGMSANSPIIRDILSHSLGIKADGVFSEMLPRYTEYPAKFEKKFYTTKDNQSTVLIEIYETKDIGSEDRRDLNNCDLLGMFTLTELPKAKKGEVVINVTFEYDESRILKVIAENKLTGKAEEIVIEYDKKEIQRKIAENKAEPMNIFFAIDGSWSMHSDNKIESAKIAAHNLINNVIDLSVNRVGVISFGTKKDVVLECDLCGDADIINKAIDEIKACGSTPLAEAFELADEHLPAGGNNYVICLTDGIPYSSKPGVTRAQYKNIVFSAAENLKNNGATILSVGVAIANNEEAQSILNKVSSKRTDNTPYIWLTEDVDKISEIFEQIIGEISER